MVDETAKIQMMERILTEPKNKVLSPTQRAAVISDAKFIKVIAGAGAGKTETLTRHITYLLLCKDVKPSEIIAFTFTEKAAQNMKSRLYQRIMELGGDDLTKNLGEMYIGTIHGYCLRILEDYFNYGNHGIFDENQEMAFLSRIGWSLGLGNITGSYAKNCEIFLNNISIVYNDLLDRNKLKKRAPDFYKKMIDYEDQLDHHRRLTFNRMSYEAVMKVENEPEKLAHIKYLIVDEFQDINYNQFKLIQLIGEKASIFVVGDPRQSIYQWRGSNESYFLDFDSFFSGAEEIEIEENRRSTKEIVRVSNRFTDCFNDVDYKDMNPTRKDDGTVVKIPFTDSTEEAEWIATQIEQLVSKNNCRYSDFGILFRSVNTSGKPFLEVFNERKIPFLVGGKVGLFRRHEAQAVGRIMSWLFDGGFWVENPYNWKEQTQGDDLLTTGLDSWRRAIDFSISENVDEELKQWRDKVLNREFRNFKEVYYELLTLLGYHNFDPLNDNHAACMANLGRFSSLIRDYEISMRLGGRAPHWKSEVKGLCWYMNSYANKAYEEQTAEDIRQINAVQITTVHQAKGLEWPIVFVPALVKGRFPSSMAGREKSWMIPRDLFDVKRYEGSVEEEKRLFYVAITRAKDSAILSYFRKYTTAESQSEFLDRLDDINVREINPSDFRVEHNPKDIVADEDIQTFSALEIIQYMKCPHHYRLNKLWGYFQATNPMIGYGNALHFCMRRAGELILNQGYSPVSAVAESVAKEFFLPFASTNLIDQTKRTARKRLMEFASKYSEDMNSIEEVESRLEFPLKNATIAGKVDVILRGEDAFEIRDYKTSDQVITNEDSDLQVRLYSIGLNHLGWNLQKGSIAYLENATIRDVLVNNHSLNDAHEIAQAAIDKIKSCDFTANPSSFCNDCEYDNICTWRK